MLRIYMSRNIDGAILVLVFSQFLFFSLQHATTSWRIQKEKIAQKEESLS